MYSYLKCIVYDKLLKPRQSFRITLCFNCAVNLREIRRVALSRLGTFTLSVHLLLVRRCMICCHVRIHFYR